MEEWGAKSRLGRLLEHFSAVRDTRERWRVAHPLPEVLLLVVCGTIASCDDYDDIVEWGEAHLEFLRRFLPYYHGIPCADWLRALMNRIDPGLFSACFMSWVREFWPKTPELIAIDGKTSRRSHDRGRGQSALHLVSAFATNQRLVLGQEAVDGDKTCELTAIPVLLERLAAAGALAGAIVTIDAIACNPTIAATIVEHGADYLLAVKDNQPTLRAELESYFAEAPAAEVETTCELDKDHGRLETRRHVVSAYVDWLTADRHYPGAPRWPNLTTVGMIESTVAQAGKTSTERRYYISSATLGAAAFGHAVRAHWGIENRLHWVLDVTFKEDLSRLRRGHGANNMAIVRHFAINLVRNATDKKSTKTRRKRASWDPDYLHALIAGPAC